jgi:hypothetical protein
MYGSSRQSASRGRVDAIKRAARWSAAASGAPLLKAG